MVMGVIGATLLSLEAAPQPQSIPLPSNPSSWPGWALVYEEDFSTPTNAELTSWLPDETFAPFDTILDDRGVWYQNDYGPAWQTAFDSFDTYRREFTVGQDGWLTVSLCEQDAGVVPGQNVGEERRDGVRIDAAVVAWVCRYVKVVDGGVEGGERRGVGRRGGANLEHGGR